MKRWVLAVALSMISMATYGHAHLQKSQPENNHTVTESPKQVVLEFNEAVRLIVLTVQKDEGKPQSLAPLPTAVAKKISVAMPTLEAGRYLVKWRASGDDGHVVSGEVAFTVAAGEHKTL